MIETSTLSVSPSDSTSATKASCTAPEPANVHAVPEQTLTRSLPPSTPTLTVRASVVSLVWSRSVTAVDQSLLAPDPLICVRIALRVRSGVRLPYVCSPMRMTGACEQAPMQATEPSV